MRRLCGMSLLPLDYGAIERILRKKVKDTERSDPINPSLPLYRSASKYIYISMYPTSNDDTKRL